jgi:hypothetical protein
MRIGRRWYTHPCASAVADPVVTFPVHTETEGVTLELPPRPQRPNDYIRISATILESPKLADIADECGIAAYAIWIHLLCAAKRARHLGRVIAPPVRVARAVGIEVAVAECVLANLERHRCIELLEDRPFHYQIRNWLKWQSMTAAERTRKHREAKSETETVAPVTESVTEQPEPVTPETHTTTTTTTTTKNRDSAQARDPEIIEVFEHWANLDWKGKPKRKPILTPKRRGHINARREDGFSVEDLCNALSGYAGDTFWNGAKDGTAHMSLERRLASVEQVEYGLGLYEQQRGKSSRGGTSYVRNVTHV